MRLFCGEKQHLNKLWCFADWWSKQTVESKILLCPEMFFLLQISNTLPYLTLNTLCNCSVSLLYLQRTELKANSSSPNRSVNQGNITELVQPRFKNKDVWIDNTQDLEIMFHKQRVAETIPVPSLRGSHCTLTKTVSSLLELFLLRPAVVSSLCAFSAIFV